MILVILLCLLARTGTFYKRDLMYLLSCLLPHDLANLGGDRSSAHRAAADFSLSLYNGRSQTRTARVAAAAAVIARKDFHDGFLTFVYFNCKFLSCNPKEHTNEQSGAAYDYSSHNNTCYTHR